MALSSTDIKRTVFGNKRVVIASLTFDSSYPTGGEAVLPSDFGLSSIDSILCFPHKTMTRLAAYDHANAKVKLYTALSTEAAAASDQSSITIEVLVVGN